MKWASPSGRGTVAACSLALVAAALGFSLQNCAVLGQDAVERLPSLQQKIIAAAAKAKPSVVRVVWRHHDHDESGSGVILTADGYVATFIYMSYRAPESRYLTRVPAGAPVSVCLADGRRVPGVAVGTFLSARDVNFDLVKITGKGVWPCAEIPRAKEPKPGDTCLSFGFPNEPDGSRDREPSAHIGHLIPWGAPGMLRCSCLEGFDDFGGGLFDLEGGLVGIRIACRYSDNERMTGLTNCYLGIKVEEQNWRELTRRKPPANAPTVDGVANVAEPSQHVTFSPAPSLNSPELAAVSVKIREASVAFSTFEPPLGSSGTIVTPDGYIATCAHHRMLRGSDTTVYLADGRTAPAKFLGRDTILDIGLVKIIAPGPWPYVPLGKTNVSKAGDPCTIAGYPNYLRKDKKVPAVLRRVRIADTQTQYAYKELFSVGQVWDGDSGGGLFNEQGRLIGVLRGTTDSPCSPTDTKPRMLVHAAADEFATLWDSLAKGPAFGDPVSFEESPAAGAVRKAIADLPTIVCEVLGDGKRRALGTIISPDGYVLTKASELYGEISCRLADGRVLPAAVRNVSREHDLALLKIEAKGLPQITWSRRREVPVGTLVAALRNSEPPTVGVVSYPTHKVAPATAFLGVGKVKNADGGVKVEQFPSNWSDSLLAHPNHPIRIGDVILTIEGRPVPNVRALEHITTLHTDGQGWRVPFVIAGDPICVRVRRDGKDMDLRFPLFSTSWDLQDKTSPRCCSFPAVFDTDVRLAKDMCGGPLVDCEGQVIGITIALPVSVIHGSPVMARVFVVPANVARAVANQRK